MSIQFLFAFAHVHNMLNEPFQRVVRAAESWLTLHSRYTPRDQLVEDTIKTSEELTRFTNCFNITGL